MIHVVLFNPEIPQNTGNIGRLCACTGARLHLIHPLGFKLEDRYLKRSAMDYWSQLDWVEHKDWEHFLRSSSRPNRLWLMTTHAEKIYWEATFADEDGLVFGRESAGCPDWLHRDLDKTSLKIPMPNRYVRSLNLSSSVAAVRYEVMRQMSFV